MLLQAQNEAVREEVLKDAQLDLEVSRLNAEKERYDALQLLKKKKTRSAEQWKCLSKCKPKNKSECA